MTERIVEAISHPLVDCIGHLTGRLLLRREPYAVDAETIFEAAAANGTMIEINGNPNRRDLSEQLEDHRIFLAGEGDDPQRATSLRRGHAHGDDIAVPALEHQLGERVKRERRH